jgi:hypothetical protein
MSPLALLYVRFAIAVVACSLSYLCLMSIVLKIEGGSLYVSSQVPYGTMDEPHKRARRTLLLTTASLAIAIALAGYFSSETMSLSNWLDYGRPAMVGGLFAMLYTAMTRSDMVRPRASN